MGKDIGINYIEGINQHCGNYRVIPVTPVLVSVPFYVLFREVSCIGFILQLKVHVPVSLILFLVGAPAIGTHTQSGVENWNFPIVPVVCLSKAGYQCGEH